MDRSSQKKTDLKIERNVREVMANLNKGNPPASDKHAYYILRSGLGLLAHQFNAVDKGH